MTARSPSDLCNYWSQASAQVGTMQPWAVMRCCLFVVCVCVRARVCLATASNMASVCFRGGLWATHYAHMLLPRRLFRPLLVHRHRPLETAPLPRRPRLPMLPPRARGCARELARPGGVFTLPPLPMGNRRARQHGGLVCCRPEHASGGLSQSMLRVLSRILAVLLGLACCLLAGVSAAFMHCSAFLDLCKWHTAFE